MDLEKLEQLAREATRPIDFAPGYEVSDDGRVFSATSNWRGYGRRELVTFQDKHGYLKVRMQVDGRRRKFSVHSIVARVFHGKRPSADYEVRHLDGDPQNNRASNLAWGTRKENAADRDSHGRTARGARNGALTQPERRPTGDRHGSRTSPHLINHKWSDEVISEIRRRWASGESQSSIGRSLGVPGRTVCGIVNGQRRARIGHGS